MTSAGVTIPDPYIQSLNQTITLVKDFIVIGKYVRKKFQPCIQRFFYIFGCYHRFWLLIGESEGGAKDLAKYSTPYALRIDDQLILLLITILKVDVCINGYRCTLCRCIPHNGIVHYLFFCPGILN
jgi:hypothetical protein